MNVRSVPVLTLPEKNIIPSSKNISFIKKPRVSAENMCMKVSALPPSSPLFTTIALPIV